MTQHKDLTGTDLHVNKLHATTHQDGGTDEISLTGLAGAPLLGSATTAVTQSAADNSTKVATTAYTDAAAAAATGTYTDEKAQDAVGAMVDTSIVYVDATPLLTRAALTGDVTASQGSNTTAIASSVALAGNPTTTTQTAGNNSTRIATTAFVTAAVSAGGGVSDGDKGDVVVSSSGTVWTIDTSVALAGSPTTTTQSSSDNSTKVATTAFVQTLVGTGAASALKLLEQHTASSSAQLDFTTCITSTYDTYLIEFVSMLPATNLAIPYMRFSTDGGATYDSTNLYMEDIYVWRAGGSALGGSATLHGQMSLLYSGTSSTATRAFSGTLHLYDPLSTAVYKQTLGCFRFHDGTFRAVSETGGIYESTTAVNAFRILMSSGNIASGTVRCYGVAK